MAQLGSRIQFTPIRKEGTSMPWWPNHDVPVRFNNLAILKRQTEVVTLGDLDSMAVSEAFDQ